MREAAIDSQRVLPRDRRGRTRKRRILSVCSAPLSRLFRAHPARSLAAAAFGIVLTGIVLNAVLFQKGRHPAPLFGSMPHGRATRVPPPALPPPRRPVERQAAGEPLSVGQIARPAEVAAPNRATIGAGASPARKEDGITRFLHSDPKAQPDPAGAKPSGPNVLAVQRALQKLGYGVKPDGRMGPATRQAIEKFEHDRHLSDGGELSPKLFHELAGATGSRRG